MNSESMSTDHEVRINESENDALLEADVTNFQWTPEIKNWVICYMNSFKPFGIDKFININKIQEVVRDESKIHIPLICLIGFLDEFFNFDDSDSRRLSEFQQSNKLFELPEDYILLKSEPEEPEEILKKELLDCISDAKVKLKSYSGPNKTRFKSLSSVDSKDDLNETGTSSTKISEGEHEEISSIRRSLRTYDKPEEKELQDSNKRTHKLPRMNNKTEIKKVTDSKQPNKNIQNQSKDLEKNNAVSTAKRKNRNVSESSFSSDNSKPYKYLKNNLTDLNVSDCSSRSVTPEMLRGKTSNRSVTPETNIRKTNLRSSDKDQKSKLSLEKRSTQFGNINMKSYKGELESYKPEMLEKHALELKSKSLVQNKNELKQGKNKTRGRLTADLMVAQQSPVIQPLGRRSCSNNKSS